MTWIIEPIKTITSRDQLRFRSRRVTRVDFRGRGREGFRRPGRGWRAKKSDVNASRGPNFLGQLVARARGPCDPPKSWIRRRGSVVVAPVTSIPTEALQSQRPMPKNRHACVRVYVRNFHSLERSLCDARNDDHPYHSGDDLGEIFRDFHKGNERNENIDHKDRWGIRSIYDQGSFHYMTTMALTG